MSTSLQRLTASLAAVVHRRFCLSPRLLCSSGLPPLPPPLDPTSAAERLEFVLEEARTVSVTADLAYLERDPTDRGSRSEFLLDAMLFAQTDLAAALHQADRALAHAQSSADSDGSHMSDVQQLADKLAATRAAQKDLERDIENAKDSVESMRKGLRE